MKRSLDFQIVREAAVLFIAAVGLGLAYNSTSPLGVRLKEPAVAIAPATAPPARSSEPGVGLAPTAPRVSYTNATVAVGVPKTPAGAPVPVAVAAAPAGVTDGALHNETIAASIISSGTDGAQPAAVQKLLVAMPWVEVKPLLERGEIILVDGRDSLSYEAGHIPGAVSLPLKMINEKIGEFTAKYPKTKTLVIYCASIQCPISHAEALLLGDQFGYTDVREMPGGYAEWMVAESKGTTATGGKP